MVPGTVSSSPRGVDAVAQDGDDDGDRSLSRTSAASGGQTSRRRARLARFRASQQVRVEKEEAGLGTVLLDISVRRGVDRDDGPHA